MAIAFDAATTDAPASAFSTRTFAHVCSGADRLLLVAVSHRKTTGNQMVNGATYNGVAMTFVATVGTSPNVVTELWRLIAPATGSHNVVVDMSASVDKGVIEAISFTGVHQTTPLGNSVTANGSSTTASVIVPSAAGELVVSAVGFRIANANPLTPTTGTQRAQAGTGVASGDVRAGVSTAPGAASVTMTWTYSNTAPWAIIGTLLRPVTAAGPSLDGVGGGLNVPVGFGSDGAVSGPASSGTARYVDGTSGSDTSGDGSVGNPWRTIANGIRQSLGAGTGTTIYLKNGSYATVDMASEVVAKSPGYVTLRPYPGHSPTISGITFGTASYLKWVGLTITGECRLGVSSPTLECHHFQFLGTTHTQNNTPGRNLFPIVNGSDSVWDGCTFRDTAVSAPTGNPPQTTGGFCMFFRTSGTKPNNITIKNNFFFNLAADGAEFQKGATNVVIDRNEWLDCGAGGVAAHADALDFQTNSDNVTITNNKVRNTFRWLMLQTLQSPGANPPGTGVGTHTNFRIENNDIITYNDFCLRVFNAPGIKIVNNTFWSLDPLQGNDGVDIYYHRNPTVAGNLPTTNVVLKNNIIRRMDCQSTVTFAQRKNNIVISSAPVGTGVGTTLVATETSTPPTFSNLAAGDLHLSASDTQAKERGDTDLTNVPLVDRDGKVRPLGVRPDIGAYEFGESPLLISDGVGLLVPASFGIGGLVTNIQLPIVSGDVGIVVPVTFGTGEVQVDPEPEPEPDPEEGLPVDEFVPKRATSALVIGPHNQLNYDGLLLNQLQTVTTSVERVNLASNPNGEVLPKFLSGPDWVIEKEIGSPEIPAHVGQYRDKHSFDGTFSDTNQGHLASLVFPESGSYVVSLFIWIPADFDGGTNFVLSADASFSGATLTNLELIDNAKRDQYQPISLRVEVVDDLEGLLVLRRSGGSSPSSVGTGVFYSDALMIEAGATRGIYFDGSTADQIGTVSHRWVGGENGSASELLLHDTKEVVERYEIEDFIGFEDVELRITDEENVQEDGSVPGPGYYGPRVMSLPGVITAGSYPKLMEMASELAAAFLDLVEKPLVVSTLPNSYFTQPEVQIYCRKADKLLMPKSIQSSDLDGYMRHPFTIALKATDPVLRSTVENHDTIEPAVLTKLGRRYPRAYPWAYDQLVDPDGNAAVGGNSVTIVNTGNWYSLPRLRFTGMMRDVRLTNEANGHEIRLKYPIAEGDWIEINVYTGEIFDKNGVARDDYFDTSSDWMRLVGNRGSNDGRNRLVLSLTDFSTSSFFEIWWQDAWMSA